MPTRKTFHDVLAVVGGRRGVLSAMIVTTGLLAPLLTVAGEIVKALPPKGHGIGMVGECPRGMLTFKEQCVPINLLFEPKAVEVCVKPEAQGGLPPLDSDCTVYTAQEVKQALTEEIQKMQDSGSFSNCDTYYNDSGGSVTVCP